jgi:hypothetical protein
MILSNIAQFVLDNGFVVYFFVLRNFILQQPILPTMRSSEIILALVVGAVRRYKLSAPGLILANVLKNL